MSEVQVDKNVPFVPRKPGPARLYPWLEMEVGDSFLVPPEIKNPRQTASAANIRYKPRVFTCRSTPDGYRIWRVE